MENISPCVMYVSDAQQISGENISLTNDWNIFGHTEKELFRLDFNYCRQRFYLTLSSLRIAHSSLITTGGRNA